MAEPQSTAAKKPFDIVVGFDFSPLAERAFGTALDIAEERAPAELHVVTVAQPAGTFVRLPGEADAISEDLARETVRLRVAQLLDEFRPGRGAVKLERVGIYVLPGLLVRAPGRTIVEFARSVQAELVAVGAHAGTGTTQSFFGSVAQQVVCEASASVYVVRPDFVGAKTGSEAPVPNSVEQAQFRHWEHRRTYHYVERN